MTVAPRFLHVANGTSVTMTLEAAGVPGLRSIWADPLHAGPVPGGLTDDELLEVRARFLAGSDETAVEEIAGLREWRDVMLAHDTYDELVLWYEHDLFDQLILLQLLTWIHTHVAGRKAVSLICIGSFPGRTSFKGLGELPAPQLASLLDVRHPVAQEEYSLAERAWDAFRQPTPRALEQLLQSDTSAMPFLARALHRFLQEYPWTTDGLSRRERRLLQLAAEGPISLRHVFPRMDEGEDAYYVSDTSLTDTAVTLSSTSPQLLSLTGGGDILTGTVSLTDEGREVLAGSRDRVACGLDLWMGGAHLHDGARIWRWDEDRQQIV